MAVTEETQIKNKRPKKSKKLKTVSFDTETLTKNDAEKLFNKQTPNNSKEDNAPENNEVHLNTKIKRKKKKLADNTTTSTTTDETETKRKKAKTSHNNPNATKETSANEDNTEDTSQLDNSSNNESNINEQKSENETLSKRELKRQKKAKLFEQKRMESEISLQKKGLNYLSLWKHSRNDWKFEKLRQIWLQQNMFDSAKIPDQYWSVLVEYLSNSKGKSKDTILKEALKVIESEEAGEVDCDNFKLVRARDILQNLQES